MHKSHLQGQWLNSLLVGVPATYHDSFEVPIQHCENIPLPLGGNVEIAKNYGVHSGNRGLVYISIPYNLLLF